MERFLHKSGLQNLCLRVKGSFILLQIVFVGLDLVLNIVEAVSDGLPAAWRGIGGRVGRLSGFFQRINNLGQRLGGKMGSHQNGNDQHQSTDGQIDSEEGIERLHTLRQYRVRNMYGDGQFTGAGLLRDRMIIGIGIGHVGIKTGTLAVFNGHAVIGQIFLWDQHFSDLVDVEARIKIFVF